MSLDIRSIDIEARGMISLLMDRQASSAMKIPSKSSYGSDPLRASSFFEYCDPRSPLTLSNVTAFKSRCPYFYSTISPRSAERQWWDLADSGRRGQGPGL